MMSDPFLTLVDHNHSVHCALLALMQRCASLVASRALPRAELVAGIHDAATALRAHHDYEEELLIPTVRHAGIAGPWDAVCQEHVQMGHALDILLSAQPEGPDSLVDLSEPLATILAVLESHFAAEEAALTDGAWRQVFADADAARAFGKEVAKHNRAGLQPAARLLPLLVYNLDDAQRARFTERMPRFVVDGLVPFAFRPAWRVRRPFMAHPPRRLTPGPLQGLRSRLARRQQR